MNQEDLDELLIRKLNIFNVAYNKILQENPETNPWIEMERWMNTKVKGLNKTPMELVNTEEDYNKLMEILNNE